MRPEILFPLFAPASSLKGVGPKIAPLVERAAGPLVRDVLFMKPQGLIERTPTTVAAACEGEARRFAKFGMAPQHGCGFRLGQSSALRVVEVGDLRG